MIRRHPVFIIVILALVVGLGTARAQQQPQTDLTGTWTLEATVQLPIAERGTSPTPCVYSGETSLTQTDGTVSGFAELFLQSGPQECPAEMSADLSGTVDESVEGIFVTGMLEGQLGVTEFFGEISPNPGGEGTFDVSQGLFLGASGTWSAELFESVLEIPVLTPVGLALLVLLLLAVGSWILLRRQRA